MRIDQILNALGCIRAVIAESPYCKLKPARVLDTSRHLYSELEAIRHVLWMMSAIELELDRAHIITTATEHDAVLAKAQRWLGFIQGCVWNLGLLTIDDLKR